MAQSTAQKLGISPQATVLALGQQVAATGHLLGDLPDGASITDQADAADVVILFADDVAAVTDSALAAFGRSRAAGRFWIAYRKGAKPLHRDTLQAALAGLGLDGVTLISIDDTWSAMRVKRSERT